MLKEESSKIHSFNADFFVCGDIFPVALSNHNKKYDKMTNLHSIRLHNFRHSNEVVNLIDNLNEES